MSGYVKGVGVSVATSVTSFSWYSVWKRSLAPRGVFLKSDSYSREYGTFARLLGRYVRGEGIISLVEAIRCRIISLPARNLNLDKRGSLQAGHFADVVIFDPTEVRDHATFEEPHQFSTGVMDVFAKGARVVKDGEQTGATPSKVVRGPGWSRPNRQSTPKSAASLD